MCGLWSLPEPKELLWGVGQPRQAGLGPHLGRQPAVGSVGHPHTAAVGNILPLQ